MNISIKKITLCMLILLFPLHILDAGSKPETFMWKAVSNNTTIYLLGSIHVAKKDLYPLNQKIEQAFKSAQVLVVEANITKTDSFAMQELIGKYGVYLPNKGLKQNLTPRVYTMLNSELAIHNMKPQHIDMMKPWFAAFTIMELRYMKLGYSPELGIDYHFLKKANGSKKILELESINYQFELLNSFSPENQALFLETTLANAGHLNKELVQLFQYWKAADVKKMEEFVYRSFNKNPETRPIQDKLLDERNYRMVKKIEQYLEDDEIYFVVVGAAHLIGKNGLVNLLKKKGFRVEQQ
ncbi:MAG: TraB/GumN family protein [bacterium]|nr:TraB/GumN family protein [bacterium]